MAGWLDYFLPRFFIFSSFVLSAICSLSHQGFRAMKKAVLGVVTSLDLVCPAPLKLSYSVQTSILSA
jgi:uncharacterized membrane protein